MLQHSSWTDNSSQKPAVV